MNITHQITNIFTEIDDFCNKLEKEVNSSLLENKNKKRGPNCNLSEGKNKT